MAAAAAWPGSGWSARSRAAARTNELEAGAAAADDGGRGRAVQGLVSRVCMVGGVVSHAPMRRGACGGGLP